MVEIDGIIYNLQRHGGISVYFNELLTRLDQTSYPHSLSLFGRPQGIAPNNSSATTKRNRLLERYRPATISPGTKIFHSSYYRTPNAKSEAKQVVTVHDFVYERFFSGIRRSAHSYQKTKAIKSADAVICVSAKTADDMSKIIGPIDAPIYVIHNGVSDIFRPLSQKELVSSRTNPFVLYVGQRSGYKNFSRLAEAMRGLPDMELVCVGGGKFQPWELRSLGQDLQSRLFHKPFVSELELNSLYNQAHCLVYPSLYEGFGIPVVEAMRAGCPVVCGPCEAVMEVGGEAVLIAEGQSAERLAKAIKQIDGPKREDLIGQALNHAQKFSWSTTHDATIEVYNTLL